MNKVQYFLIFFGVFNIFFITSLFSFLFKNNIFITKTVDDGTILVTKKNTLATTTQVLGANNLEDKELICPKEKPIIGWVDYFGNKKIVDYLDPEQKPSICFKNFEEANKDGFFR